MSYNELIYHFETSRDYMRDFYVYGFRKRGELGKYSDRAYDNERQRIQSWLRGDMTFYEDKEGKTHFISVDSRAVPHNPLYIAFRTHTVNDTNITLYFYVLDLLQPGVEMTPSQLSCEIGEYLNSVTDALTADQMDISTNKLKPKLDRFVDLGLLKKRKKNNRDWLYSRVEDRINPDVWRDAVAFFSETDQMGVIGSFILEQGKENDSCFYFRHHYIVYALDSEVLEQILEAIRARKDITVTRMDNQTEKVALHRVTPVKILVSTENGRQYLLAWSHEDRRPYTFRLDRIHAVKTEAEDPMFTQNSAMAIESMKHLWGASFRNQTSLEHLEMTVHVNPGEDYIVRRLEREKRCGTVEKTGDTTYKFTADVYDAGELKPWIRTFIGRIDNLVSSNPEIVEDFKNQVMRMKSIYGSNSDGI